MDPFTLMGLFGLGSTIFGGIGSLIGNSQSAALSEDAMMLQYENQMKLQHDAQNFSTQQMKDQQQFALDMWNRNNEYNSQSSIDERLREAGRNPYLSNSSNVASVATTPGGSSSAGQGSAALANPSYTPLTALAQHFMNSGLQSSQMMSFLEDVKGKKIDNMFRSTEAIYNLKKLGVDIEEKELGNYAKRISNMFAKDMAEQDYLSKLETNKNLRLQGESMGYTIAAQALQNAYLPQQLKLDVMMKNAQLFSEYQRGKLTEAQYKYQLIQTMISKETKDDVIQGTKDENKQKTVSYDVAKRTADYLVRKAQYESYPSGPMDLNRTVHDWRDRVWPYDLERSTGDTLFLKY